METDVEFSAQKISRLYGAVVLGRSAMLRELYRWMPANRLVAGSRWSDWSNRIAERYGMCVGRINGLDRVLVRALRPARTLRDRWLVKSRRFFPGISLSVHAVLGVPGANPIGDLLSRDVVLLDRWHTTRDRLVHSESERLKDSEAPVVARWSAASPNELDSQLPALSPVERIVQRKVAELLITKRSEDAFSGPGEQLIQRLVRQSLRFESTPAISSAATSRPFEAPSSLVVARQSIAANEQGHQAGAQEAGEATARGLAFDGQNEQRSRSQDERARVAASIEQIADQVIRHIDRKVVAARERMGRTF